jgi:molecular chaperone DnaK (HSP70)
MARLGIDFGTTNTVAMIHDRGMICEVLHSAKTGAGTIVQPIFPSAILIDKKSGQRWFGIEADRRFGQIGPGRNHVFIPSLKSCLRDYTDGRRTTAGEATDGADAASYDVAELLRGFLKALAESIRQSQSLAADEPLETVITWPANANGAQRHVTRKCFREAGFRVVETLNEPTASAIELADCLTAGRTAKLPAGPSTLAVFDLGGGTFDASVVRIEGQDFRVLASGGIGDLGGDDFDRVLFDMFLKALRTPSDEIGGLTRHALLRQARSQKETISTGVVRSLFLNPRDFGLRGNPVSIPVETFYERIRPMIRPAIRMLRETIDQAATTEPRLRSGPPMTVYLVGGSSKLPLVAEMVAHAFPAERVILTDKPFTSVAMGAAICAVQQVHYRDVFARHFGLIRLRDHGRTETFDTIFPAGTPIPRRGEAPLEKTAWYHPRHNIGHLRYLECTAVGPNGLPSAGIRAWSDIRFPYDPVIPLSKPLADEKIVDTDSFGGRPVCEVYRCDADGVITVELKRPGCQDARTYEVCRD